MLPFFLGNWNLFANIIIHYFNLNVTFSCGACMTPILILLILLSSNIHKLCPIFFPWATSNVTVFVFCFTANIMPPLFPDLPLRNIRLCHGILISSYFCKCVSAKHINIGWFIFFDRLAFSSLFHYFVLFFYLSCFLCFHCFYFCLFFSFFHFL